MASPSLDALLRMSPRALADVMRDGHSLEPRALEGWEYRGTSLGLPELVERATWKTFQKTFYRDPTTGQLRGWNVCVEQRGIGAASVARWKGGAPDTWGPYVVVPLEGVRLPRPCGPGLLIHYGLAAHGIDPLSTMRDPIVALDAGNADRILGWSYVEIGPVRVSTPSYFLLERERDLSHVRR